MALKLYTWHEILEEYQDYLNSDLGLTVSFLWQGQIWENAGTQIIESFEDLNPKIFKW